MTDKGNMRSNLAALWRWIRDVLSVSTPTAAGVTNRSPYHLKGSLPEGLRELPEVLPSRFKVEERLHYRIHIGERIDLEMEKGEGVVRLQFPYDNAAYFTESAHTRLAALRAENSALNEVLVGYLGFSNQANTSFHIGDLGRENAPAKVPVWIPVRRIERYRAENSVAFTEIKYEIGEPSSAPVRLEAQLSEDSMLDLEKGAPDEVASFHAQMRLCLKVGSDVGNISQGTREQILKRVAGQDKEAREALARAPASRPKDVSKEDWAAWQANLKRQSEVFSRLHKELAEALQGPVETLTTSQIVKVIGHEEDQGDLPETLRKELAALRTYVEEHPGGIKLAYLGLEWPFDEGRSRHQDQDVTWTYNPETGRMETRGVVLKVNRNTGLYERELQLEMFHPRTREASLRGKLVLEIDRLVSGSRVSWLSVDEDGEQPITSAKTYIMVEIEEIRLDKIFAQRALYPQRWLAFPGVLPVHDRARDAENILGDVGLTIIESPESVRDENLRLWRLTARQQKAGDPTRIWLYLYGQTRDGTRTITYDSQRRTLQGPLDLGDTHVVLLAQTVGNHTQINALFDDIQTLLESRFGPFRVN